MTMLTDEEVEKIKKSLRTGAFLDDFIAKILLSMTIDRITTKPSKLHQAIYRIKDKYPELKDITFDESGVIPFSDELDSVFFRLGLTGLISCQNTSFDYFRIREETRETFTNMVDALLTKDQCERLTECAKELSDILKPTAI